jgi:hypothetical protein
MLWKLRIKLILATPLGPIYNQSCKFTKINKDFSLKLQISTDQQGNIEPSKPENKKNKMNKS